MRIAVSEAEVIAGAERNCCKQCGAEMAVKPAEATNNRMADSMGVRTIMVDMMWASKARPRRHDLRTRMRTREEGEEMKLREDSRDHTP